MTDCKKAKVIYICPTPFGHAVFIKAFRKIFVIYMDKNGSSNLNSAIKNIKLDRPSSHDLIMSFFDSTDAKIDKVLINHEDNGVFHSIMYITMENELGKKIIELEARPSDSLSLAIRQNAPIYILNSVLNKQDDMSKLLEDLEK